MNNQKLALQMVLLTAFVLAGVAVWHFAIQNETDGDAQQFDTTALSPASADWSWEGLTGKFDRGALQRGFHVYKDICSACHGLDLVAFRTLEDIGLSEDEVKAIAAEYTFAGDPDEFGDPTERPGIPADYFPAPFANEQQARSINNGAFPPDLSLIVKARPGGEDYFYSLMTGYTDPPDGFELDVGMNYNPYFSGRQIAMGPPLFDDMVEYADGTPATADQMSRDLTAFLTWAAEPTLEARHEMGFKALVFLAVWLVIMIFSNRRVWAGLKKGGDA